MTDRMTPRERQAVRTYLAERLRTKIAALGFWGRVRLVWGVLVGRAPE